VLFVSKSCPRGPSKRENKANGVEWALFSSEPSPSFPLWLRPKAALGGAGYLGTSAVEGGAAVAGVTAVAGAGRGSSGSTFTPILRKADVMVSPPESIS